MTDRHVVIGTAGHVDHGKTALVRALTGIETDRWEEERRRGITIDLGFAHLDLGDAGRASIVDVPGHEDFVRNMVAGATGVDVALLVVAADEGVMPQTREHLDILRFLDVRTGVVAVTKTDLVDPEWLELVLDEVREVAAAGRGIAWEPPVPVSARSGVGLEDLKVALAAAAGRAEAGDPTDLFRMPVDRVFSVAGAGTVVTGTTWSGAVAVGDEIEVLPAGVRSRVRGIEVHGEAAERATPGRRTALALVGVDRAQVGRGSFAVRGEGWAATRRLDAQVTLLPHARPLGQRSRIRVHVGTAEVMARVTPAGDEIAPGSSGIVRLRLEAPIVCRWGDRGVLRSYSPMTTMGGCRVIDPQPDARPRRPPGDGDFLVSDPARRVGAFVRRRGPKGLALSELPVRAGLHPETVESVVAGVAADVAARVADWLVAAPIAGEAVETARQAVADFHRREPLQPGLPLAAFRRAAGDGTLADYARVTLEAQGRVVVDHGMVRLPEHRARLEGTDARHADALQAALDRAGSRGIALADIDGEVPREAFVPIAEFLVREGGVVRVGVDRYYRKAALQGVVSQTLTHLATTGRATPAELREVLGLSRKYLIPLLEWMDGQGLTSREGDARRPGPNAEKGV